MGHTRNLLSVKPASTRESLGTKCRPSPVYETMSTFLMVSQRIMTHEEAVTSNVQAIKEAFSEHGHSCLLLLLPQAGARADAELPEPERYPVPSQEERCPLL